MTARPNNPFAPLLARGSLLITAMCELATAHRVSPATYTDLWASGRRALAVRFGVRPDGTPQWPADAQRDALVECYLEVTTEQPEPEHDEWDDFSGWDEFDDERPLT